MRIDEPILTSFLDDDLYKLTTGAVAFHFFPRVKVTYEFFNRGKTKFPFNFDEELKRQISMMSFLKVSERERDWMLEKLTFLPPTYIEWLYGYRLDPDEVFVSLTDGDLKIVIRGYWFRAIFWEVKLMSIISELYFRLTGQKMSEDWEKRIISKAKNLEDHDAEYIEFGTRRRYSYGTQERAVDVMRHYKTFLGTSNPYLAMKYGVPVKGTYPHEAVMAMSANVGAKMANHEWQHYWFSYYQGQLAIALPDTFTTDVFLKQDPYLVNKWDGYRQDSGDPYEWVKMKIVNYFWDNKLELSKKTLLFSNNLRDKSPDKNSSYIDIHKAFGKIAHVVAGIGTSITNDVGVTPLNMVIKMTGADFGKGMIPVVKLSDDVGKHTGGVTAINRVKKELGIE
jgi:nicotinate phosphoribosyltransferase